ETRLQHLCATQLIPGDKVFDAARAKACICRVAAAQRRNDAREVLAPWKRVADAVLVERDDLRERARVREIADIHPSGLRGGGLHVRVEPEISPHEIGAAISVGIDERYAVPPPLRSSEARLRGTLDKSAILL